MQNLLNVYEIEQTTVQRYMACYDRHAHFVKNDLFKMLTST